MVRETQGEKVGEKQYGLTVFSSDLEIDLYNQRGDELSCRKVGLGEKYHARTMERNWRKLESQLAITAGTLG